MDPGRRPPYKNAGAQNPYIWPENLPRINAEGGPGGKPGYHPINP
nr:hypothetical protein [Mycobacterium kubicae]